MADEEQAHLRIVSSRHFFCSVLDLGGWVITLQGQLHIGLPGGHPDVPDENVVKLQRIARAYRQRERAAGWLRRQIYAPAPGFISRYGSAILLQGDGDMLSGCSLAPDVDGHLTLQHHMAGEDAWQSDFSMDYRDRADESDYVQCHPDHGFHTETIHKFQ